MYSEKIIQEIRIVRPVDRQGNYYFIENIVTGAFFILRRIPQAEGEYTITYKDCYDNLMMNNKDLKITFSNDEVIQLNGYRSQVYFSNHMSVTALPMKDIQEIANKTFYTEGQYEAVDFVKLHMFDYNKAEFLLRHY
ncbi:hypothetical protein EYY60_10605 [Flavobacterium zhairuonense]|uniref:hypothetical protein n=1 Tax=Flavobacterium zhairuonense TaxID=2493631 RepID=UPI00104DFC25|nr:hypothetical protein [Flavobacterium zhairuonense]KAF2509964.1 hypothetical protein EYY60_10605 [Flavobacterium zhairuonense]